MSNNGRALISALNNGDYDAVDRLNLSETDLRIVNQRVHELFERAIGSENLLLFETLLKIPMVKISSKDYCALRHASQLGQAEYLQRLEGHPGVKPSLKDKSGFTALHLALIGRWAEGRAIDLVRVILGFPGLKVNARNLEKRTALHYAMSKEYYEVAEMLMDAGANPSVEDAEGQSPTSIGLMATLPDSLFGKMLSFTGSADDFDDEEDTEEEDAPLPDGTLSPEEVYRQMNSHKPADMQTPDPLVDLSDPDRRVKFGQDQNGAPPAQQPPVYNPPGNRNSSPGSPGSSLGNSNSSPGQYGSSSGNRNSSPSGNDGPPPAHHKAIDPLAAQWPSVNHNTPLPAKQQDPAAADPQDDTPDPQDPVHAPAPIRASPRPQPYTPAKVREQAEDTDDFLSIMGAETLEEIQGDLNRAFLLNRSEFDARFRLHRRAVIERLEDINAALSKKDQALRAEDFRTKDPTTGFNLWHVAAATGQFEKVLQVLVANGEWPNPEDLSERTEAGKSIPDVLEDMNRLSGILHSEVWTRQPRLLAALLSELPAHRLQQFSRLITRTNLQILHG